MEHEQARILIVEDENVVALDLEDRLRQIGHQVVGVTSTAAEAVRLARELTPELVLMDIRLKGAQDGIEAAAAIQRERPVPIVFLTAFADDATIGRAKQVRPYGYVLKPYEERELQVVIEMALFRSRTEKAFRAQHHLLATILNSVGDAVISLRADQTLEFLNPAAEQLLGWTAAQAAGRPRAEVLVIDSDGETSWLTTRLGARRAVEVRTRPLEHADQAGAGSGGEVLVLSDVTERRREEERQRFSARARGVLASSLEEKELVERLCELLVPSIADWCVLDLAGFDDAPSLRLWRESADRGFVPLPRPRDLRPSAAEHVLEPGLAPELASILGLAEAEAEPFSSRMVVSMPLFITREAAGQLMLGLREPGRRFGPLDLDLVRDLARRVGVALENARLYRTARAALRTRDDVLAIVSHDLRNPLAAIQIGLDALRRSLASSDPRSVSRIEAMRRAAQRMTRLVSDLLDVATIDSGRLSLRRHPAAVRGILEEAVETFEPLAAARDIRLESAGDVPARLLNCDRERIAQLLGNLIGNALKFTPAGGRIILSAEPDGADVRFSVRDTGSGIPASLLTHLFDRRWQAPSSGPELGSGLGLYIARGIVEAHGGRIWVEGAEGGGSTFCFTLPAAAGEVADEARA